MKTQDDHRREPMEMWKEEYDQIPVPQEARDGIEAGIMRAKLEKKRSDRMKNMKRTGVTAAALVLTFGIAVNASPVVAQAMDGIPVIGSIARVVTIRNYNESTNNGMMADISVPQIDGNVADVMSPYPIPEKLRAFGFEVAEIDGHDFEQIEAAFTKARETKGVPFAIVMKTTKGKGVSFMENQAGWHGKAPNDEEYEIAMKELSAQLAEVEAM